VDDLVDLLHGYGRTEIEHTVVGRVGMVDGADNERWATQEASRRWTEV